MTAGLEIPGKRRPATRFSIRACADGLLLALFLVLICLPLVTDVKTEESEKRVLAERPKFELTSLQSFPKKFDAYFNDRFGFRDPLIRMHNYLKVKLFGVSPVAKVIVGSDGWLFYNAEKAADGVSVRDYRGLLQYTPEQLETIVAKLKKEKAWLDERGIVLAVIICPNKESIYPEHLPAALTRVHPATRLDQLMAYLRSYPEIPMVDPRAALLGMKAKMPVYFKTDTHWNELGGFLAYRGIMNVLRRPGLEPLELEDFDLAWAPFAGDISVMITMQKHVSDFSVKLNPKPQTAGRRAKLGKALVFGDSFLWGFHPFLANHFDKVVVRVGHFAYEAVEAERPDVVIVEMVERYQARLL